MIVSRPSRGFRGFRGSRHRALGLLGPALTLGLVLGAFRVQGQTLAAPVEVTLTPPEVTIGEPVTATIRVLSTLDQAPTMPDWSFGWGEAEIVNTQPPQRDAEGWSQTVTLRVFRTGEVALPPLPIRLADSLDATPLATPRGVVLRVRSVLPGETRPASGSEGPLGPKPARAPESLAIGNTFWWTAASGAALALALAAVLWLRRVRSRSSSAVESELLPPLDELVAALARIEAERPEQVTKSHVQISAALRRYLGRRLEIPALPGSTPEIRRALARKPVPGELASKAVDLLRELDAVKFARHPASAAEVRPRADRATAFAREIESRLVAAAPAVTPTTPPAGGAEATTRRRNR